MQALILAGGEGTRLRPLTATVPKPAVTLVDRPFLAFMLDWLRGHGFDDVVLSCGFLAEGVRAALGDGSRFGVRLRYVEEPEPLGTGGALKLAEPLLDERFAMLNGDVLTDLDLGAQLERHVRAGARATLALVPVEDPSAYGLVRTAADGAVRGFLEKPRPEEIDTDLISAGAYILERGVLELIEPGRKVSIEREVWPRLVGNGLYAHAHRGAYWLDIGSPERYLEATFDILAGRVRTPVDARGEVVAGEGCEIAPDARVGPLAVLGAGVRVQAGAVVERAVVLDGAEVGAGAVVREAIVAPGVRIGARARIVDGAVIGAHARIGAGNVLGEGARVSPETAIPDATGARE